jgi:hypothetical protein
MPTSGSESLIETVRRERRRAIEREPELEAARHSLQFGQRDSGHFAYCACQLWTLEAVLCATRELAEKAVGDRHLEHVERLKRLKGEFGFIVCGGSRGRKRCQSCTKNWASAQCDYPTGGDCPKCKGSGVLRGYNCGPCAGTGRKMCNKHLCSVCTAKGEPDEDYCPDHRVLAGFPPLVFRELCAWSKWPPLLNRRDCLRESCEQLIEYGDQVLYFPRRGRAMCRPCGKEYMRISITIKL